MKTEVLYSLVIFIFISNISCTSSGSETRSLSRRKRYLVFPEGSSMTVAFCFTINLLGVPTNIFTEVVNIGINYDLPNSTMALHLNDFGKSKEISGRRHRRDLYNKMEIILNAMGLDGKTCVHRALCEAAKIMDSSGDNLLEEIITRLFRFPLNNLYNSEPEDHKTYHWAHRIGREIPDCEEVFPNCHISLFDLFLGYKKLSFN